MKNIETNLNTDKIAASVGSWSFIIIALSVIAIWIVFNSISKRLFDPFPFILLNLVLSCMAISEMARIFRKLICS
jgi:uncharacterized membrane protein